MSEDVDKSETANSAAENTKENTKKLGRIIGLGIDWFEVTVLSLGVAALAVLLIANVFARSFFQSIYYADEVSKFLIILVSFVGISYAARKARHIRMGAFLDMMPPKLEKTFIFVISAINATVMFIMAYYGYMYMAQMKLMGQMTSALQVPYWTFMIIVPIGFASAGIQYVRTIIKNIIEKDVWLSPEQQSEYEEEGTLGY
ncbi:MAG: TRAP transporter small permease [Spirochaetia bacterium]|nr:TRAP transporter small permease [Spirochaetia bacterium]